MKKVLILGGSGMLGHKAWQMLSKRMDAYVTFRNFSDRLRKTGIFQENKVIDKVDAFKAESVGKAIGQVKPDFVINCIGIIKQLKEAGNPRISIYINSLLPHLIAEYCADAGSRLIHISTDCVFSGRKGKYVEGDFPDAEDLYGRTKYLGEAVSGNSLTLRTSIIGRELFDSYSLVDWFFSQNGKTVKGYRNAVYTGFTTIAFSKEIERIINNFPDASGLYHISSAEITKFELLSIIRDTYDLNIRIEPFEDFHCDRSLDSTRYAKETGFSPPSWREMILEMREDETPYNKWRQNGTC